MPDFAANPTFLQNITSAGKRKLAFVLLLQRIKSKLGFVTSTDSMQRQRFFLSGPASIPEERTFDASCNGTVNNWFTFGGLQCRPSGVLRFYPLPFVGCSPLIIGMTVVSVGTSLPEIIVSAAASMHDQVDLAVGTAIGSNIVNILLILGLAALLHPFRVHSDVLRRELPLMLIVSLLAGYVLYDGQLTLSDGIFLLALAVIWLFYIVKLARAAEKQGSDTLTREQVAELPREGNLPVALLWLGVALIIMPMATQMIVDNATVLANYFAMSELTIGLTVIAIGTSLPELATAIAGARKGEDDMAIGNIIGSNIFNIAIVLGLPALIAPGAFNPLAFSRDYGVMVLVSVIFALLCWRRKRQIGQGAGALLTVGFVVWMAMLYWLSPLLSG